MLEKSRRIARNRDFEEIFSRGKGTRLGGLFLKARLRQSFGGQAKESRGLARFAVVVSKKVAMKAVKRNRIRRILREALRKTLPLVKQNVDAVLVVLPQFQARSLKEAAEAVQGLLRKALLIK
ncbi:MAG: ribonuclease P protein component [Candidatus Wildermuthbacteria bacterium]|nr:ribonuclease P protein component [Candidatus Wildermuthbacteria bacterium]